MEDNRNFPTPDSGLQILKIASNSVDSGRDQKEPENPASNFRDEPEFSVLYCDNEGKIVNATHNTLEIFGKERTSLIG